jgi:cell division protein FtsQ
VSGDRFAARTRAERRRRIKRVAAVVLAVLLAGTLGWLVWFSDVLAVHGVDVDGRATLKQSQVLKVAKVPDGEPLARVDLTAIEARIASMDRVESVDVSRSWPSTISIDLVERTAVMWATDGTQVRGIDRNGIDYRSYRRAPSSLVEAKIGAADPDERLRVTEAVATVVDEITRKDHGLRRQLQAVSATTKDSIELDLTEGRVVVWGSASKTRRKLEVLDSLLTIDAARYDVSAPDQPTTRK